ncbi:MAG: TPR repeat protein [Myxococcota bacterium]|jgi:TPR repeat protein
MRGVALFSVGLLTGGVLLACGGGPPSTAVVDALALDFGEDGVVPSPERWQAGWDAACDAGWACGDTLWRLPAGPDEAATVELLSGPCSRGDVAACLAVAWATLRSTPGRLSADGGDPDLVLEPLQTACEADIGAACTELARMHQAGVGLEADLTAAAELAAMGCDLEDHRACRLQAAWLIDGVTGQPDPMRARGLLEAGCQAGLAPACFDLGVHQVEGRFGVPAAEAGASAIDKACTAGHVDACAVQVRLARARVSARKVDVALIEGWRRACEVGRGSGCHALGQALDGGWATGRDADGALAAFRRGCDLDDAQSCTALAETYAFGEGIDIYEEAAAKLFGRGCELGDGAACRALAERVVAADGRILLTRGCDLGEALACGVLADRLRDGVGGAADPGAAAERYRRACSLGDPESCTALGRLLTADDSSDIALAGAEALHRRACDRGSAAGCNNLGFHLERNRGNPEAAAELYATACDMHNYGPACTNLGRLYREGNGVSGDPARAAQLYHRACAADYATACNNLGWLHEHGLGVDADPEKAVNLYAEACTAGVPVACENRRRLTGKP